MIKRPLLLAAGSYVIGVLLAIYKPWLCVALAAIAALNTLLIRRSRLPRLGWLALAFMLCLSLWSVNKAKSVTFANWQAAEPDTVQGRITGIVRGESYDRLFLSGQQAVVWMPGEEADLLFPGQRISVQGKKEEFAAAGNPGQFDSRAYYQAQGYAGQIWAETWTADTADNLPSAVCRFLYRLRCRAEEILEANTYEDAGILKAILLGEKSDLEDTVWDLYRDGGAAHLLSVSGLHVSILCMGLYRLLRKLHVPLPLALFAAAAVCLGYVWLSGASVSAKRAGIMFGVWLGAVSVGRTYDLLSAVSLAALMLLVPHPLLITQVGFQLSFAAVLLLAMAGKRKKFAAGLWLYLGLAPILAWHYGQITLVSSFVNLCILPLAPVLFLLGLGGCIAAGLPVLPQSFFFLAAHGILQFFQWICQAVQKIPFAVLNTGRPAAWQIALYLFACGLPFLLPRIFARRWKGKSSLTAGRERLLKTAAVLALIGLPVLLCRLPQRGLMIVMLDVGQGECLLTHFTDGSWMMTDGGSSDVKEVWRYRMQPYLTAMRITRLDYVLVTHGDGDHCSGVIQMLEEGFPVRTLLISAQAAGENTDKLIRAAVQNGTQVRLLKAGDGWNMGKAGEEASLNVLWPEETQRTEEENAASVVYRLESGAFSMLFTGDLPGEQEQVLIEEGVLADCTVLKAAHHGSRSSGTEAFLREVQPECTLISSGRDNRYGHPHAETLQRLYEAGSSIYGTARDGAITIYAEQERVRIETYR